MGNRSVAAWARSAVRVWLKKTNRGGLTIIRNVFRIFTVGLETCLHSCKELNTYTHHEKILEKLNEMGGG